MKQILEYQIIESVSRSQDTVIYRAKDGPDKKVILKLLSDEHINARKLARFKKEYEITCHLSSRWIVKPLDLVKFENTNVMVFEDIGGNALSQFISQNSPCINNNQLIEFLEIALFMAQAVNEIHNQHFIHKDINPTNIVYNRDRGILQIIDLGLATKLQNEQFDPTDESLFEGTYAYISPEQTGRFNRVIDYRTDFYSLGISLYELFSGRLPYNGSSPREWIHCHIARKPKPLHELVGNIPKEVSDIVMKLMHKNADQRYQSGFGIVHDLNICLQQLKDKGKISRFNLAEQDVMQTFQMPQKLYGRENEIRAILDFYKNLQKNDRALLLVNGYSGIGKTSIIQEIQRPVIENNGYFAGGKFDPAKKNMPYHAFLQAISKLVKSILGESTEEIQQWKHRLLKHLQGNGKLITELIPELELIVGLQPDLPALPPSESQNRILNTFNNLINAFTSKENPLVLFLDDMQWADAATLDLIENLLINHQNGSLLLIGAYRNNEVDVDHHLMQSIEVIQKAQIKFRNIHIHSLMEEAVKEFVVDTFALDNHQSESLVQLIISKTDGNPFYIIEYIKSLVQENLLYFQLKSGKWMLKFDEIEKSNVTENVAEFISKNIQKLSTDIQYILKYAACIGSSFNASLICHATQKPWEIVISLLNKSADESLIYPLSEQYRFAEYNNELNVDYKFVHDRVQQEIYTSIDDNERKKIHYELGNILLHEHSDIEKEGIVFNVLEHLNQCIELLTEKEKSLNASLNLRACRSAKATGAFDHALYYANVCNRLIDSSTWQSDFNLAYQIHKERAESLFLVGNYTEMDHVIEKSLPFIENIVDKVQLRKIRVQSLIAQHRQPEAVNEALETLKLLDVRFPKKPATAHILFNFVNITFKLKKVTSVNDLHLQTMTDAGTLAAMDLMATILSASYYVNPNLFPLIVFKLIQFTLSKGIAPKSPVAFVTLGLIEWALNRIDRGYLHGGIGMKMFEQIDAPEHWSQAACIYSSAVMWNESFQNSISGLFDAYQAGMDTGDNEFAVASAAAGLCYKFYAGCDLRELYTEHLKYRNQLAYLNQNVPYNQIKSMLQTIHHLIEETNNPEMIEGEFHTESEMLPHFIEVKDNASALDLYLKKMVLAFIFNRYDQAMEIADKGREIVKDVAGLYLYAGFHFYESLILLAQLDKFSGNKYKWVRKRINNNLNKFNKWSKHCPANFKNKYLLIQAEIERHEGNVSGAIELYDQAIKLAQDQENLFDQALGNELAGLFWYHRNKYEIAEVYLFQAHKMYNLWGAYAKADAIKDEFNGFFDAANNRQGKHPTKSSTTSSSSGTSKTSQSFDMAVVIEAAKTLSSEIIFSDLIKKTLTIILEHGGAQKGILLIIDENQHLSVEAMGYIEDNEIKVELETVQISQDVLPQSIIYYTERSKETVILHDAKNTGEFIHDEYIQNNNVKSVITIPILHQSKFLGILYLENNLSTHVFNQDRVDILTILCTQAAISLENAILYNSLEQKVNERTREISEKNIALLEQKEEIEATHDQLVELNATKDKFFSILAHDLRGPIANINQFFDILSDEEVSYNSEEFIRFVNQFKRTSKNTYDLLNNLLIWAQTQRNELSFEPQLAGLNELVITNMGLIEQKAESKGVTLINNINTETTGYFDINLIDTVLRNLLNNALKYAEKGDSIEVNLEKKNGFIMLSVKDTGIGMDDKIKKNLFSIQNKSASKKGTNGELGTGLGLILCKEFVERNGGQIWVESQENVGSTFYFTIPVSKDAM